MKTIDEWTDFLIQKLEWVHPFYSASETDRDVIREVLSAYADAALGKVAELADDHNGCVDRECSTKSNCGASIARQARALMSKARVR